jgi:hypothetical protein
MSSQKFINISERYGEPVEVTISDYQDLNPTGIFEENPYSDPAEIREILSAEAGDYEVVARAGG